MTYHYTTRDIIGTPTKYHEELEDQFDTCIKQNSVGVWLAGLSQCPLFINTAVDSLLSQETLRL